MFYGPIACFLAIKLYCMVVEQILYLWNMFYGQKKNENGAERGGGKVSGDARGLGGALRPQGVGGKLKFNIKN